MEVSAQYGALSWPQPGVWPGHPVTSFDSMHHAPTPWAPSLKGKNAGNWKEELWGENGLVARRHRAGRTSDKIEPPPGLEGYVAGSSPPPSSRSTALSLTMGSDQATSSPEDSDADENQGAKLSLPLPPGPVQKTIVPDSWGLPVEISFAEGPILDDGTDEQAGSHKSCIFIHEDGCAYVGSAAPDQVTSWPRTSVPTCLPSLELAPRDEPTLSGEAFPSVGSMNHHLGTCKPCVFIHKQGCAYGNSCSHCHLCDPDAKKRRKAFRLAARWTR